MGAIIGLGEEETDKAHDIRLSSMQKVDEAPVDEVAVPRTKIAARSIPSHIPSSSSPSFAESIFSIAPTSGSLSSATDAPSLAGRVTVGPVLSTGNEVVRELEEARSRLIQIERQIGAKSNKEARRADAALRHLGAEPAVQPAPVEEVHLVDFPNLAWEAIKAGLAKEKLTNDTLNGHIATAEKHQQDIDLLLDLSAELTSHKDGSEMSDKLKNTLAKLKEKGIDLWKSDDTVLTREKLSELKSLTTGQIDKLRSNLQIIFTTKIQVLIQSLGTIIEVLKDIIRNNSKLISAANRLPGR